MLFLYIKTVVGYDYTYRNLFSGQMLDGPEHLELVCPSNVTSDEREGVTAEQQLTIQQTGSSLYQSMSSCETNQSLLSSTESVSMFSASTLDPSVLDTTILQSRPSILPSKTGDTTGSAHFTYISNIDPTLPSYGLNGDQDEFDELLRAA
jgi:hypothetical protein